MSFSNDEVRQIDRHNRILLNKIVAQQRRPMARPTAAGGGAPRRTSQADQIRRDNLILLQKIHGARPSRSVISGFHDEPPPVRPILERGAVRHRRPWVDR
ncbi:cilia- and flagella-associated protein 97-like [Pollicipes pollicipes]|uniref:cilia- and flagella-associated protein 97-like n=1 Tax=Pollicipes pollicipes TaxID=41117 RepID=UPI001884E9F1|nr:cilia- and flagella-associated protein 97-like [Pollicipes pollicipes]